MATDETLSAAIKVRDQASKDLQRLAGSFKAVAETAQEAAKASIAAAEGFDEAGDEASELYKSLNAVAGTSSEAGGSLQIVSASAEAASEGIDEAEDETDELNRSLSTTISTASAAAASLAGFGTTAAAVDGEAAGLDGLRKQAEAFEDITPKSAIEVEGPDLGGKSGGLAGVRTPRIDSNPVEKARDAMRGSDGLTFKELLKPGRGGMMDAIRAANPNVQVEDDEVIELRETIRETGDMMESLPKLKLDISDEKDFEEFVSQLKLSDAVGNDLVDTLQKMDDEEADGILRQAESVDELKTSLRETGLDTRKLQGELERLDEVGRRNVDTMLHNAESVNEFETRVDELGGNASAAAAHIEGLDGQGRKHTITMAKQAESTDELGDELRETGNQAVIARLKMEAMDDSMGSLQETIGQSTTRIGPFRTTLAGLVQMLPMIISLVTVLGGALTTAAAGAVGFAGIFGGGLLAKGEQIADRMQATATATGEASDRMQQLDEASSDAERSMIGLQELMTQVRDAAYEALEPLRQPIFAEFSTKVINNALTLLGEFAQVIAWGGDELMDVASVLGAAFWDTYPRFMDELVNLMQILGPILVDFAVGAIKKMPAILALMAEHSRILAPMLMDFGKALLDLMPMLLEVGTMMLRGIIPNLTGFLEGVAALSPYIILLARVIGDLLAITDPYIRTLFKLGGAAMALTSSVQFLVWSLFGLKTITEMLLLAPIAKALSGIGVAAAYAYKGFVALAAAMKVILGLSTVGASIATGIGVIVLALAAVISYFDLWDEVIWGVIKAVNFLIRGVHQLGAFFGNVFVGIVNSVLKALNNLIDQYNALAGVLGMEKIEFKADMVQGFDYETPDSAQFDASKADQYASYIPFQDSDGGSSGQSAAQGMEMVPNPGNQKQFSDSGTYTPRSQRAQGRSGGNQPYTNIESVNVTASGEADERRIADAVRRGVRDANKRDRRKNSPMN